MPASLETRLRDLMATHNVRSARELGAICNVSAQAASRWLNGGDVTEENLRALAAYFHVDWLWLRYGDEAKCERRQHDPTAEHRRLWIEELRANELRLKLAMEAADMGVWTVNLLTGELRWDEQTCRLFGRTPEEAPQTPSEFFAIIWPEDVPAVTHAFEWFKAHPGETFVVSYRYTHRDGHARHFTERARLVLDPDGAPIKVIGVVRDTTAEWHLRTDPGPVCGYRRPEQGS